MSKTPIEKQTAHERWELANFGDDRPSVVAERAAQHTAATMQQLREIAKMKEEAKAAGHAEGYSAGYDQGMLAGKLEIESKIKLLEELCFNFQKSAEVAVNNASAEILDFSLELSKAMIGTALEVQPELLLTTINKAVKSLPINNGVNVIVNTSDAALVQKYCTKQIESQGWHIIEDDSITPGGFKLETTKNFIDSTVESRWKTLVSELTTNTEWISNAAR